MQKMCNIKKHTNINVPIFLDNVFKIGTLRLYLRVILDIYGLQNGTSVLKLLSILHCPRNAMPTCNQGY